MNDILFKQLCRLLGNDPDLIQGPGGNASVKEDDIINIKASGKKMSDALKEDIFAQVSLSRLKSAIEAGNENFAVWDGDPPSIETPLHVLFPQKYVFHLHFLEAIVFSILVDPPEELSISARLNELSYALIPYARPGIPLYCAVSEALGKYVKPPDIVVLRNHGIIIASDTLEGIIEHLATLRKRLSLPSRPLPAANPATLEAINDLHWQIPASPRIHALAFDEAAPRILKSLPLYPDQAVFLGAAIPVGQSGTLLSTTLEEYKARYDAVSDYAVIPGAGVLTNPDITQGKMAILESLGEITSKMPKDMDFITLTLEDIADLCRFDAEKRRLVLDEKGN